MAEGPKIRPGGRARRLRAAALVAALIAVLLSAFPGTASAVRYEVDPLVNCYYQHTDGSVTVVLGYRSTYPTTQTIPVGTRNSMSPSKYSSGLPTVFKPGTNNGVVTMRIAANDVYNASWTLDGSTVSYWNASGASICTQAQLPAFANGAVIAGVLLAAGLVGVLVIRRVRRNLLSPRSANRSAQGGHRA